jgi:hypothetical protein
VRERLAVDGDDDAERVDVERVTATMLEDERVRIRVDVERDTRCRRRPLRCDTDHERDRDAAREHHRHRNQDHDAHDRTDRAAVEAGERTHDDRSRGLTLERSAQRPKAQSPAWLKRRPGGRRTLVKSVHIDARKHSHLPG